MQLKALPFIVILTFGVQLAQPTTKWEQTTEVTRYGATLHIRGHGPTLLRCPDSIDLELQITLIRFNQNTPDFVDNVTLWTVGYSCWGAGGAHGHDEGATRLLTVNSSETFTWEVDYPCPLVVDPFDNLIHCTLKLSWDIHHANHTTHHVDYSTPPRYFPLIAPLQIPYLPFLILGAIALIIVLSLYYLISRKE